MDPITLNGVSRSYGSNEVFHDLTFNIPEGQVVALLGRNGAGKSTLYQVLYGLLAPDRGEVRIFGHSPVTAPEKVRQVAAFVTETCHLYPWMTGNELAYMLSLCHPGWEQSQFQELTASLQIPADRRVDALSKGNRQKLMLALALGAKPRLLLLDEPLSGFDAVIREEILNTLIQTLVDQGVTILLSSHEISEIAPLCDRILLLSDKILKLDRPKDDLTAAVYRARVLLEEPVTIVPSHPSIVSARGMGTELELVVQDHPFEELGTLLANLKVKKQDRFGMTLKEIFIALTVREKTP